MAQQLKSTHGCSSRGTGFNSQHSHGGSRESEAFFCPLPATGMCVVHRQNCRQKTQDPSKKEIILFVNYSHIWVTPHLHFLSNIHVVLNNKYFEPEYQNPSEPS